MLSSISNFTNTETAYMAQSALSAPTVPAALKPVPTKGETTNGSIRDVYESADGTLATRNDLLAKAKDSAAAPMERTEEEKAQKVRDYAERIRRDMEARAADPKSEKPETEEDKQFRELLHQFVGQVLFGQMLKAMRSTQEKNPYFHGGRAEEIFQSQLDMVLTDEITKSSSRSLSDPMYRLMRAPKAVTD